MGEMIWKLNLELTPALNGTAPLTMESCLPSRVICFMVNRQKIRGLRCGLLHQAIRVCKARRRCRGQLDLVGCDVGKCDCHVEMCVCESMSTGIGE